MEEFIKMREQVKKRLNFEQLEGEQNPQEERHAPFLGNELENPEGNVDQGQTDLDMNRLKTFAKRASELPRDKDGCCVCLLDECSSKQLEKFYSKTEIGAHARKYHGIGDPSHGVKKYMICINHKPIESNGVELKKLVQKQIQRLNPGEKEKTINTWICVRGNCAFKPARPFNTLAEFYTHNLKKRHNDFPESQLIIEGLHERIGTPKSYARAGDCRPDPHEDDENWTDHHKTEISMVRLKEFVQNALIKKSFPNDSRKNLVCLVEGCPYKVFEKLYDQKEITEHVWAEHGISNIDHQLIRCRIYINHNEKGPTESDAAILKRMLEKWEKDDMKGNQVSLCIEEDCASGFPQLVSPKAALHHHMEKHCERERASASSRENEPSSFFPLRIMVLYEKIGAGALNPLVQRMSRMVSSAPQPGKSPKRVIFASHLCLIRDCTDKPLHTLYSKDEIIKHAQSVHQVRNPPSDLIKYRLLISHQKDEASDPYDGSLKILKLRLRPEGTVQRFSDTDGKEPLTNIQTVDFGLCMITDCAFKHGSPFDNVKDLEDHVKNYHIRTKNLVKGKEISYFTVYPLLERTGPSGPKLHRQISTDSSGSNTAQKLKPFFNNSRESSIKPEEFLLQRKRLDEPLYEYQDLLLPSHIPSPQDYIRQASSKMQTEAPLIPCKVVPCTKYDPRLKDLPLCICDDKHEFSSASGILAQQSEFSSPSKGEVIPSHKTDLCDCALRVLKICRDHEEKHQERAKPSTLQEAKDDEIHNRIRDFTEKLEKFVLSREF